MEYPRPITQIHQVEITSRCNLSCAYCPSPVLETVHGRAKKDMSQDIFERTLEWVKYYDNLWTQQEFWLHGIGESLLHPKFLEFCEIARMSLPHTTLRLSTNGLLFDHDIAKELSRLKVLLHISLHRPEKAGIAVVIAQQYGILEYYDVNPVKGAMNWAGQVNWPVTAERKVCGWLRDGWGAVLQDGRITTCCYDASGAGVVGHVNDEIGNASIKPYSLCNTCHLVPYDPSLIDYHNRVAPKEE